MKIIIITINRCLVRIYLDQVAVRIKREQSVVPFFKLLICFMTGSSILLSPKCQTEVSSTPQFLSVLLSFFLFGIFNSENIFLLLPQIVQKSYVGRTYKVFCSARENFSQQYFTYRIYCTHSLLMYDIMRVFHPLIDYVLIHLQLREGVM